MPDPLTGTPALEQLQFDLDVAGTAHDDAMQAVAKALAGAEANLKSTAYIQDSVAALHAAQAQVQDAIPKVAVARGAARQAAYDAASVKAAGKAVVAAIKRIAGMERALLKADTAVDRMVDRLVSKENEQSDREIAYEQGWARLSKRMQELESDRASLEEALQALKANADKAVQQGRPEALELKQSDADSLDVDGWIKRYEEARKAQAALEDLAPKVGSESRQAAAGHLRKARSTSGKLEGAGAVLQGLKKAIKALKAAPPDAGKLARQLGLPDALKGMLAKALAQPPAQQPRALDAVAQSAGLKITGKSIVKMLAEGKLM